jgi:opacity protein-like surface antigen
MPTYTRPRRTARAARAVVALAVLASTPPARTLGAQATDAAAPASRFAGFSLIAALPQGQYADFAKTSWGGMGNLLWPLGPAGLAAVRLELGYDTNSRERSRGCAVDQFGDCVFPLDIERRDNTLLIGVGPQFTLRRGMLQPYVTGTVGLSYLSTVSELRGINSGTVYDQSSDFDDASFVWTAGGGVYVPLTAGPRPMLLDIAARYHGIDKARYLARTGSLGDNEQVRYHEVTTSANSVVLHLGMSFAF